MRFSSCVFREGQCPRSKLIQVLNGPADDVIDLDDVIYFQHDVACARNARLHPCRLQQIISVIKTKTPTQLPETLIRIHQVRGFDAKRDWPALISLVFLPKVIWETPTSAPWNIDPT